MGLDLTLDPIQVMPELILLKKHTFMQHPVFLEHQQHPVHLHGDLLHLVLLYYFIGSNSIS